MISKLRGQFADLRPLDRRELSREQLAIEDADSRKSDVIDEVPWMAGDVQLGREQFAVAFFDLEVNVRRGPAGVGDRLDRAEAIAAVRSGQEPAEALEILVALVGLGFAVAGVDIDLVGVALPDFDGDAAHRTPRGGQHPTRQLGDLADGRSDPIVDNDQVVVGVERELVGIERPFFARRRAGEFELLGEHAASGEKRRARSGQGA